MTKQTNETAQTADLLPCPFCGDDSTTIKENGRVWLGMRYSDPVSVSIQHWCIQVDGQPSRMIERIGRDMESAIAAWNRRISTEPAKQDSAQAGSEIQNSPIRGLTNIEKSILGGPPIPSDFGFVGDDILKAKTYAEALIQWQADSRQARELDVPDGWKLVPLLPTSEMVCALMSSMLATQDSPDDTHCIVIALAHAIDAAPQPNGKGE